MVSFTRQFVGKHASHSAPLAWLKRNVQSLTGGVATPQWSGLKQFRHGLGLRAAGLVRLKPRNNSMTLFHWIAVFGAAFVAGMINSVAGGGTLLTFPSLVWLGQ